MNINFHQSRDTKCDAILDQLEADEDEGLQNEGDDHFHQLAQFDCDIEKNPKIVATERSKWSSFVSKNHLKKETEGDLSNRERSSQQLSQHENGSEHKQSLIAPEKSKWSSFVSKKEPQQAQSKTSETFHEKCDWKGSQDTKPSIPMVSARSSSNSSYVKPSFSIYYQPKPAPLPKLIDLHKKPTSEINQPARNEPPPKKMKQFDQSIDDDFILSQDDLNFLDNLK